MIESNHLQMYESYHMNRAINLIIKIQEEDRPGLADEVALGVAYQDIDDYLEGKEVAQEAAEKIENWYLKTQHKRELPITVYDEWWKK